MARAVINGIRKLVFGVRGEPLAGVSVEFIDATNVRCKAVTDERGRYELLGVAKSEPRSGLRQGSYVLEVQDTAPGDRDEFPLRGEHGW